MRKALSAAAARKRLVRPRVIIYSVIWLLLAAGFVASLALRTPLKVDIIRDRGALGREVEGRWVENVYRLQLINTTEAPMRISVRAESDDLKNLTVEYDPDAQALAPTSNKLVPIRIRVPIDDAAQGTHKISVTVTSEGAGQGSAQIRQSTSSSCRAIVMLVAAQRSGVVPHRPGAPLRGAVEGEQDDARRQSVVEGTVAVAADERPVAGDGGLWRDHLAGLRES